MTARADRRRAFFEAQRAAVLRALQSPSAAQLRERAQALAAAGQSSLALGVDDVRRLLIPTTDALPKSEPES